ncbi:uncharacterized protein LOC118645822 [Monomorium pharaonis]|uniref:uncharacterized protein LOC118645822 n=1 Tax=Monomorium pharaonis TaxID=307658 RepID=UPI001746A3DC|nr:uncharacterized protein LOC118645822 [Monomorium pharaonis]
MDGIEKDLMTSQYHKAVSCFRYVDQVAFLNMDNTDNSMNREKIVKEIAKTSDSIRKKYRALKAGKVQEEMALERHFKPIVEPLKQIVENTVGDVSDPIKNESFFSGEDKYSEPKPKRKRLNASLNNSIMTSTPVKKMRRSKTVPTNLNETSQILHDSDLSYSHVPSVEDVFEVAANELLVTSIRQQLETREGREKLHAHYGPLSQKYMGAVLSGKKPVIIDTVYGAYFTDFGTMLGDKRIDIHKNDNIVIDGKIYMGTPGLYELIFMKMPNMYTNNDLQNYKNILLVTNAYRRGHIAHNQVMGNKGSKYKNIIAPLVTDA